MLRHKILFIIFFVFLVVLLCNYWDFRHERAVLSDLDINLESVLRVYFLDVGQGDATLISAPGGIDILIDGGPDDGVIDKLGLYLPIFDRKIEYIILTHPDSDHITGLIGIFNHYQVGKVFMTGIYCNSAVCLKLADQIDRFNVPVELVVGPQIINLGVGLNFTVVHPFESFADRQLEDYNNSSIVGRLVYGSSSIMFTGDLENEEVLIDQNLLSDIYQVGHHGSSNANDYEFIQSISPDYAVISCGLDNRFGHPTHRTLNNLKNNDVAIFRTDLMGDILFVTDGNKFEFVPN